jgi:hypothetical protein
LALYTLDGRALCTIKAAGLRLEALTARQLSLSPDTLALVEAPGSSRLRFFDAAQVGVAPAVPAGVSARSVAACVRWPTQCLLVASRASEVAASGGLLVGVFGPDGRR